MKILSHRGLWQNVGEKNTPLAFSRSFGMGFGTETDVRDRSGELVISHDMPIGSKMSFAALLSLASESAVSSFSSLTLAINIKADGLASMLRSALERHTELDAFVFDMSVPDTRAYFSEGVPVFTRCSEVEPSPVWLDRASGIWLDCFESDWHDVDDVRHFLDMGKRVCIVSPELHRRPHQAMWERLKEFSGEDDVLLCTDFPQQAKAYFFDNQDEVSS